MSQDNTTLADVLNHYKDIRNFPQFCAKFLTIRNKKGRTVPFKLNNVQMMIWREVVKQYDDRGYARVLICKARQLGSSAVVEAMMLWYAIFHKNSTSYIGCHESGTMKKLLQSLKTYYDNCTFFSELGINYTLDTDNTTQLTFEENGSEIISGNFGSLQENQVSNKGRGMTIGFLHISEIDFIKNAEKMTGGIFQCVPNERNTIIILESTAENINSFFHKKCMSALRGDDDFGIIFAPYFLDDDYRIEAKPIEELALYEGLPTPEKYYEELAGEGLTAEHLTWREQKIKQSFGTNPHQFCREYPHTIDEAFFSSNLYSYIPSPLLVKNEITDIAIAYESTYDKVIMGVDVALDGDDETTYCIRKGNKVLQLGVIEKEGFDFDHQADQIVQLYNQFSCSVCVVDKGGVGAGLVGVLQKRFINVVPANFGGKSVMEDCINKTAEMFKRAKDWFSLPFVLTDPNIPNDLITQMKDELCGRGHKWVKNIILQMESKVEYKKRLGRSPDVSDSFLLTFYVVEKTGASVLADKKLDKPVKVNRTSRQKRLGTGSGSSQRRSFSYSAGG